MDDPQRVEAGALKIRMNQNMRRGSPREGATFQRFRPGSMLRPSGEAASLPHL